VRAEIIGVFEHLVNLPNHHIYLKLMIDGETSRPFSAVTMPPPEVKTSRKDEIIEASRKRFGRPRKEVERDILARPVSSPPAASRQGKMF